MPLQESKSHNKINYLIVNVMAGLNKLQKKATLYGGLLARDNGKLLKKLSFFQEIKLFIFWKS